MARDHTKNNSNYVSLGTGDISASLNGVSGYTVIVRVWVDAFTGSEAFESDIITWLRDSSNTAFVLLFDTSGANNLIKIFSRPASEGGDNGTGTLNVTAGAWHTIGVFVDIAGDLYDIYLDGALDTQDTSPTWTSTTYVDANNQTSPDSIGVHASPPTSTTRQLDGRMGDLAIFTGDIGLSGHVAFHEGSAPHSIGGTGTLIRWWEQDGSSTTVLERSGSGFDDGTITGTVAVIDGPPRAAPYGFDVGQPQAAAAPAGGFDPVWSSHSQIIQPGMVA